MVASKVEIITKSYKDEPAAHWSCDGSPQYTLEAHEKTERGTETFYISQKILLNSLKNNVLAPY